jgi:cell division protein FtsW
MNFQNKIRSIEVDNILFICVLILAGIGIAMVYSASAVYALKAFGDSFYFLKRQIAWACVGFVALFVFQRIDYHIYVKYTKLMLLASFVLLILLLIPGLGHSAKGSVRWFAFNGVSIQPAEFIKVFIVIYLVKIFSSTPGTDARANRIMQLLIPMIIIFALFILIILQPNFGTAANLLAVFVILLFISGFSIVSSLLLSVVSIPMFYLLIYQVEYRKDRILAYFNPWKERFGNGYHIIQSFIAFKNGGLSGLGLGLGTQKLSRLPEPHTDFIFAVIAEESGFIGTAFIIILYCIVFWRGLTIAFRAEDELGSLLAVGLTLLIVTQAFMNIGVVCGALPTTGLPLPLISYGGSSFLSCMISLGILLNISRQKEEKSNAKFWWRQGELINE